MRSDLNLEHPAITALELGGYPEDVGRSCPDCGGDLFAGGAAYEIEGRTVCEECFREWARDYLLSNPREVARALNVDFMLLQTV